MTVRLAAQFTKETRDRNGLIPIADAISDNRQDWNCYAVVRLECLRVNHEGKDGWVEHPTVSVVHIEPLDGDAAEEAGKLLTRAYETRTGRSPIPGVDDGGDGGDQPAETDGWDEGPVAERPKDEWLDDKAKD